MKRLGLSPHFCAATLFLAAGLRGAEEAQSAAAGTIAKGAAEQLREISPDMLDVSVVKPAAGMNDEALRRELLMRFDRNGDGRLDDGERATLRAEIMRPPGSSRKGLLEPDEAALLRKFFLEEFRASSAGPARPETVAERLARRRAESLRRAEQPRPADAK